MGFPNLLKIYCYLLIYAVVEGWETTYTALIISFEGQFHEAIKTPVLGILVTYGTKIGRWRFFSMSMRPWKVGIVYNVCWHCSLNVSVVSYTNRKFVGYKFSDLSDLNVCLHEQHFWCYSPHEQYFRFKLPIIWIALIPSSIPSLKHLAGHYIIMTWKMFYTWY